MSIFERSVTCSFFFRNCTHILTGTQGKKFEDMFLVKIASKGKKFEDMFLIKIASKGTSLSFTNKNLNKGHSHVIECYCSYCVLLFYFYSV